MNDARDKFCADLAAVHQPLGGHYTQSRAYWYNHNQYFSVKIWLDFVNDKDLYHFITLQTCKGRMSENIKCNVDGKRWGGWHRFENQKTHYAMGVTGP